MRNSFFLLMLAIIVFMVAVYYGRWSPAQRNFVQSAHVVELSGTTSGNLIPLLENTDTLVIKLGAGGQIQGMIDTLLYLRGHPEKTVVIDGPCFSACTMLLSAKDNVLLTADARLFFHSSYSMRCEDGIVAKTLSPKMNDIMLRGFIPEQQEWIKQTKAFGSTEFTELNTGLIRRWYWRNFISMRHIEGKKITKVTPQMLDQTTPQTCFSYHR